MKTEKNKTLKEKAIVITIKSKYIERLEEVYITKDVEEAILEFESYYKQKIKKYPLQRVRFQNMIDKHKEIFGDF